MDSNNEPKSAFRGAQKPADILNLYAEMKQRIMKKDTPTASNGYMPRPSPAPQLPRGSVTPATTTFPPSNMPPRGIVSGAGPASAGPAGGPKTALPFSLAASGGGPDNPWANPVAFASGGHLPVQGYVAQQHPVAPTTYSSLSQPPNSLPPGSTAPPTSAPAPNLQLETSAQMQLAPQHWATQQKARDAKHIESVLLCTLRGENEQLQQQLLAGAKAERELRSEVHVTRVQTDQEKESLMHQVTNQYSTERETWQREIASRDAEVQRLRGELAHVHELYANAADTTVATNIESTAVQQQYEAIVQDAMASVDRMTEGVEAYQRHIFPKFYQHPGIFPQTEVTSEPAHPLTVSVVRLDRGILMLRMIVDARLETMALIAPSCRQALPFPPSPCPLADTCLHKGRERAGGCDAREGAQEEKSNLEARLHSTEATKRTADTARSDAEGAAARQQEEVRKEFAALQTLYQSEMERLQQRLKEMEKSRDALRASEASAKSGAKSAIEKLQEAEREMEAQRKKLEENDITRESLATKLAALEGEHEASQLELKNIKLSQKFLNRSSEGGESVPQEKMDTLRVADSLLKERNKLLQEKLELEKQVRELQKEKRVHRGVSNLDVALAATNRVSDIDITARLVRQKMGSGEDPEIRDSDS
ncbi:hypothetical protein CYMTET_22005 [Cymbomonas tetramitiformis]|uniref:Uncharacterized protein n=1 Tax=Cymbomonas tetramitiformis TaxID=36881 RepID=A0AAE0G193_9CHLO|nr:hypothetical protein CYMTET_22005 [Cymbomonas tetramitiformis]